jgi:hypothetical protein
VTGDGAVTGLFVETAVALDLADTEVRAVGAVAAVRVGEPDCSPALGSVALGLVALGLPTVGLGVTVACGRAVTVTAGRGSALAGALEFRAARPIPQVPTPRAPETAQATVDFDQTMVGSFRPGPTLTPRDEGEQGAGMRVLSSGLVSGRSHIAVATKCSAIARRLAA